jgi:hypothetical protein
MRGQ